MTEPPITWEQLETYRRFAGDLDGHVRSTGPDARVLSALRRIVVDDRDRAVGVRKPG